MTGGSKRGSLWRGNLRSSIAAPSLSGAEPLQAHVSFRTPPRSSRVSFESSLMGPLVPGRFSMMAERESPQIERSCDPAIPPHFVCAPHCQSMNDFNTWRRFREIELDVRKLLHDKLTEVTWSFVEVWSAYRKKMTPFFQVGLPKENCGEWKYVDFPLRKLFWKAFGTEFPIRFHLLSKTNEDFPVSPPRKIRRSMAEIQRPSELETPSRPSQAVRQDPRPALRRKSRLPRRSVPAAAPIPAPASALAPAPAPPSRVPPKKKTRQSLAPQSPTKPRWCAPGKNTLVNPPKPAARPASACKQNCKTCAMMKKADAATSAQVH